MGLFDRFRKTPRLAIADCLSRNISRVSKFPATLNGQTPEGATTPFCRIYQEGRSFFIESLDQDRMPLLDGDPIISPNALEEDQLYSLALTGYLIVFGLSRKQLDFGADFAKGTWRISPADRPAERIRLERKDLNRNYLEKAFSPLNHHFAYPGRLSTHFPLKVLTELAPKGSGSSSPNLASRETYGVDSAARTDSDGTYACPICWKSFSEGETMNIAVHEDLTGDPELGPHAKLRFYPERFNNLGQALDPKGVVSVDLACPHCRGRLPPSFLTHSQSIFSLVGAPNSGKSYYLATLLKLLPDQLVKQYQCILQDGDPTGNVQLNEMKNRLFSATIPEDAFISKTDFEGLMYEHLPRNGKIVALPRPFVYHLRRSDDSDRRISLVFYDNAGEHFKPTVSMDDSPGALHVATSAALFFLYDPTTNRDFRARLRRKRDPQLRSQATDEQDTILAEMGVRLKKLRAKESHELVDTPLAIMAGKFDLWKSLLPEGSIVVPEGRSLTADEIENNSTVTRSILMDYCPTIVANAESISSNVKYFPISPLGHSPKVIEEGPLAGKLAPQPRRIKPLLLTEPTLWALQFTAPWLADGRSDPAVPHSL